MNLPKITSAMLVLTHKCNLRCRYCFVSKKPQTMSYQTALDAANFLIANAEHSGATPNINFFGGEPMLEWETIIVPLTRYVREKYGKPFEIGITTNGTLLSQDRIDFMKANQFSFLLSCDGGPNTQNYNRPKANGEGSFEDVQKWLPSILAWRPGTTFRMTAIPATCQNLMSDILFAEQAGFTNFFVMPNEFEEWPEDARAKMGTQIQAYCDYYIESYRQGKKPIVFLPMERCFKEILLINQAEQKGTFRTLTKCQACGKCGLGASRFAAIHPDGSIYACQELTSNDEKCQVFRIGDIYAGVDDAKRKRLMDWYDGEKTTGDHCEQCLYNRVCDGDCVANNYLITGSINTIPAVTCWWRRLLLDSAVRVMSVLGDEENELFQETWARLVR